MTPRGRARNWWPPCRGSGGLPNGHTAALTLTVSPGGKVGWDSPDVELAPVDGQRQLAVTSALTQLGETLTRALPESAFDEAE